VAFLEVPAAKAGCSDDALGVSRTMEIDASPGIRLGSMQYGRRLPLRRKEVVLTFDDGPLAGATPRVLEALAAECVKATFFMVGRMALSYPGLVREVAAAGHTIGTHSYSHPKYMKNLALASAARNIERGFEAVAAALGDSAEPAPFFRFPGLSRSSALDAYLLDRGLAVFSADIVGDDWRGISPSQILKRVLSRLERQGSGIILLHDIKQETADMLPRLLDELKARGYKIVHLVPKRGGTQLALRGGVYEDGEIREAAATQQTLGRAGPF
jgi:peptidoglycan/xylan/chitin deacetylase (PgdA/CDA1 family)